MANKKNRKAKIIFLLISLIVLSGLAFSTPKLIQVLNLLKQARSIVLESSYDTFKSTQTTVIYDFEGTQLCTMRNAKDLYYLEFEEIPTDIMDAFVIMEDKKFNQHLGIDLKGILRAIIANQKSNDISQGASTITQQLARNLFLTHEVSWDRKMKEAFISIELEKKYSKQDILEFYLNNIYFANAYYGIEAAAKGYFSKSISELTLSQKAFLSAIPHSPTRYDPIENFEATLERRNLILDKMYENNKITLTDYNMAQKEAITLNQQQVVKNNYVETYVRRCATESMMMAYGFQFKYDFPSQEEYDTYKDLYDDNYSRYQQMLLNGGYSVYTSINLSIQGELAKAIDQKLEKFTTLSSEGVFEMQSAATCIDNSTGNVVAIVGGRSQDLPGYTLNRAYQSYRQSGSSIKPLSVYTPFLQQGNTPDTIVRDEFIKDGPKNVDGIFSGEITLREAVRVSKNTVAWKIYEKITPQSGIGFLFRQQFKKVYPDKNFLAGSLGGFTYGVTTEEMAGGYATLANEGIYRKATCIVTIKNPDGKLVVDEIHRGSNLYDVNATRMMTDMLKTVVESGTGKAANIDNGIVAGKSGSTNSNKDAWFVGYSKYYTTSVWVGYDMPQPMDSPWIYTCAIWKQFMTSIHNNLPILDFADYHIKNTQENNTETETKTETKTEIETKSEIQSIQNVQTTRQAATEKPTNKNENKTSSTVETQTQKTTFSYGDMDATITGGDQDATIKIEN